MPRTIRATMKLSSPAFEPGGEIPVRYTCDGEDINPPLFIQGVPEHARSLALIVDDPDAPQGTMTHWLLWNLDPRTTEIPEDSVPPQARQGKNSFGTLGYEGPCPASTTHRYRFQLYALNTRLTLPQGTRAELEQAIQHTFIDQVTIVGRYGRE